MKPYRDEEGHWVAIDSNPFINAMHKWFEQYAKEHDFVEVVRCKDCKWRETEHIPNRKTLWWCNKLEMSVGKYDYCCWAERREDDAEGSN